MLKFKRSQLAGLPERCRQLGSEHTAGKLTHRQEANTHRQEVQVNNLPQGSTITYHQDAKNLPSGSTRIYRQEALALVPTGPFLLEEIGRLVKYYYIPPGSQ